MSDLVLVVDDSEVTRAILSRTLRNAGFQVLEARDGAEGAVTALRERPAVVITDLEMPTMDGFPLLRLLKADPLCAHIPVLILTSHAEAASRFWSLRTGADAYLTKDHRPQQLIATVTQLAALARETQAASPSVSPVAAGSAGTGIGPLDVLARVARQLDANLLRATIINTLLECGMAAADFGEVSRAVLSTLSQVVDARFLAVAVAEPHAAMTQIVLLDPCSGADLAAIQAMLAGALDLPPDLPVESQVSGGIGDGDGNGEGVSGAPFDLARCVQLPLALRGARGLAAVLPRDSHQLDPSSADLFAGLTGPLTVVLDNARLSQRLHEMSILDGLTRQLNHRAIYDRLTEELERARRYKYPLSVILCDLDHFKEVNDTHGHLAGDAVLREGAGVLRRCLRSTDLLGRYGGEEFLAVLPQVDRDAARAAAERLRQGLERTPVALQSGVDVHVTGSFGLAARDELAAQATGDLLVSLADRRLYEAKAAGRNCIRP